MRKILILCTLLAPLAVQTYPTRRLFQIILNHIFTLTSTATASQPDGLVVSVTTPFPSPTPFIYTVKSGDTMGQIAQNFNISLSALTAANPNVDPNTISVGQTLKIPSQQNLSGASTPTPVPFPVKQIACYPTADRGMWCFVLVSNNSSNPIEDVTAQITLLDFDGKSIASQTATLPLDILSPNSSLPLTIYFAPDIPLNAKPQAQILTAIQIQPNDPRYLPASLQNTSVQVDASGLTAQVNGQVVLAASSSSAAKLIWIAAIAYDESGRVIGGRRWESTIRFICGKQSAVFVYGIEYCGHNFACGVRCRGEAIIQMRKKKKIERFLSHWTDRSMIKIFNVSKICRQGFAY